MTRYWLGNHRVFATDGTDFTDADCRRKLGTRFMAGFRVHILFSFLRTPPSLRLPPSHLRRRDKSARQARRLFWLWRRAAEIIVPVLIKEAKKRFGPSGGAIFFEMRVSRWWTTKYSY